MNGKLGKVVLACGLCLAFAFGVAAVFSEAVAGPGCVCPAIYDPVQCSNGQIYSNACVARCAHAKGCVSIGGGPIQVE